MLGPLSTNLPTYIVMNYDELKAVEHTSIRKECSCMTDNGTVLDTVSASPTDVDENPELR